MKTILGHEPSEELKKFKSDFELHTGMKVDGLIESANYFHWKRLVFNKLDCEDMIDIATYINRRFTTKGQYTHLGPSLSVYDRYMCLTVDVDYINRFL